MSYYDNCFYAGCDVHRMLSSGELVGSVSSPPFFPPIPWPWPLASSHPSFTLSRSQLRMCRYLFVSSNLLLSEFGFLSFIIHNFSVRQTSHLLLPLIYSWHFSKISHLMLIISSPFFSLPHVICKFGAISLFSVHEVRIMPIVSLFERFVCASCVSDCLIIWWPDCGSVDNSFCLALSF